MQLTLEERNDTVRKLSVNLRRVGIHHMCKTAKLVRYAVVKTLKGEEIPKDVLGR